MTTTKQAATDAVNQVRLVGRVSQTPEERLLPSGDRLWTFRVVVPRSGVEGERRQVDALECAAWTPRAQRSVARWAPDDLVEVIGSVRRRFFRAGGGVGSRVEVEMASGRLIRRATSA